MGRFNLTTWCKAFALVTCLGATQMLGAVGVPVNWHCITYNGYIMCSNSQMCTLIEAAELCTTDPELMGVNGDLIDVQCNYYTGTHCTFLEY
jgi:hypothetical protein